MGGAYSAYGGEERRGEVYTGFWWVNRRERDHLGDPGVGGRIIFNGSSGSGMWGYGLDRAGSGLGQGAGTCECVNEPLGSIKCRKFLANR